MRFAKTTLLVSSLLCGLMSGCGPSNDTGKSGSMGANPSTPGVSTHSAPKAPTAPSRPDKADYTATAESISKEWFADETATAAKYVGKWVELTGNVHATQDIALELGGAKREEGHIVGYLVRVKVPPADLSKTWYLAKGQKVRVFARVLDFKSAGMNLDQATVTELEPSRLQQVTAEALADEYAKDASAAQKKYRQGESSKDIVITGVVADVVKESGFSYAILAGTGKTVVRCEVMGSDWSKLKKGDKVTLKGNLTTFDPQAANAPKVVDGFLIKKE